MSEVLILYDGYSKMDGDDTMIANCTCTLIKGSQNIIVDTMTAWDSLKILSALQKHCLVPDQIDYVISTHGHSDHIGNNNLFLQAKHIVGFSVNFKDKYLLHPFDKGENYVINESVKIIPTPGHTLSDVTVLVKAVQGEVIAISGDLFEKFEDIEHPNIWIDAGSENPDLQSKNRLKVAELADWIVPGHGKKFQKTLVIVENSQNHKMSLFYKNNASIVLKIDIL
ncbi:metallo-beta-lactamase domain-containing protein 1 [Hyposmocoma kahamanoa]|uniref:metallo-beta-lactamase domain-containing protein 1 n=1 Tax=Hyposmocoma kahamanoa TaxID=1477025 RepID=UPI000E6D8948|nr:metallo-beta-lactamase domain-containing protein 1 [Hyposmocoma kahamanoa]